MQSLRNLFRKITRHPQALSSGLLLLAIFMAWISFGAGETAGFSLHDVTPPTGMITFSSLLQSATAGKASGTVVIQANRDAIYQGTLSGKPVSLAVANFANAVSKQDTLDLITHHVLVDGGLSIKLTPKVPSRAQIMTSAVVATFGHLASGALSILFFIFMAFYLKANMSQMNLFKKKFTRVNDLDHPTRLVDVAGMEGPKEEVREIIDYLKRPNDFARHGARAPRGILLYGPPGNGKTLLAKAVAGESGVPFLEQNASSFVQMFVGAGAMAARDLFKEARSIARQNKGCVIFIDEIDGIGGKRDGGMGTHDERLQTLNALLSEMDGFTANEHIVVMAATNRIDSLDPALLRPGRFDRKVYVPMPGPEARAEILARYMANLPHCAVDPSQLVGLSQGMSGADLANWVNEAAIEASRGENENITIAHFQASRDRILVGPKNHGVQLKGQDRQGVAWHEAGHAVVRIALGGKVNRVSIVPRGPALGVTFSEPDESSIQTTRNDLHRELAVLMAGRAAEEIYTPSVTSGAANDIQRASTIAFEAVTTMGLGPEGVFVPQTELGRSRAEKVAAGMVQEAYQEALTVIRAHDAAMRALQAQLVAHDEADSAFLQRLFTEGQAALDAGDERVPPSSGDILGTPQGDGDHRV
ncbi:AAA family ATPase [Acidithiobacillus sp. MC6.1]|nr:AAA family ATPase [Acidithiobacillus sp. MC6.1]